MATQNLFELLGDEESDATAVIERAATAKPVIPKQQQQKSEGVAKLPSKPLPPTDAFKESSGRGRGRGSAPGGYGGTNKAPNDTYNQTSRGGGFQRDRNGHSEGYNGDGNGIQRGWRGGLSHGEGQGSGQSMDDVQGGQRFEGARGRGQGRGQGHGRASRGALDVSGGYRGGSASTEHQGFERRNGLKKDANAGGDWGIDTVEGASLGEAEAKKKDEEKPVVDTVDKQPTEDAKEEMKLKEEDKEMSLSDYYKALDEKRKHFQSSKIDERKVIVDSDFERMTLLDKKHEERMSIELIPEKDKGKKKEVVSREDKAKRNINIHEYWRPMEGRPGRGRGRGRGGGQADPGGYNNNTAQHEYIPSIEDPSQFPTLGAR